VRGGDPALDELVVSHDAAVRPHQARCTGAEPLVLFSLFGPDLHHPAVATGRRGVR
jgi:hypothetical protein